MGDGPIQLVVGTDAPRRRRRTARKDPGEGVAGPRLRIFPRPPARTRKAPQAAVVIKLSDLYPLLAEAYRDNFVWLRDFEEDEVLVSGDFFEVVRAFAGCRPSA